MRCIWDLMSLITGKGSSKVKCLNIPSQVEFLMRRNQGTPWLRSLSVYFCWSLRSSEGHLLWFLMGVFPLNETSIENSNLGIPVLTRLSANVSWEFIVPCAFIISVFFFFPTVILGILLPSSFALRSLPSTWHLASQRRDQKSGMLACLLFPHGGIHSSKPPANEQGDKDFFSLPDYSKLTVSLSDAVQTSL